MTQRTALAALLATFLALPARAAPADEGTFMGPELHDDGTRVFLAEGVFSSSDTLALDSARQEARRGIERYLRDKVRPPLHNPVPTEEIERMVVSTKAHAVNVRVGYEEARQVKYELELVMTRSDLHQLRRREHLREATSLVLFFAGLLLLATVFFRLDEWTRGYLTGVLALAAVVVAAILGVVWWTVW